MIDICMLKEKAKEIRISTIKEIAHLGKGHIGGSMSIVEILVYLYYQLKYSLLFHVHDHYLY